VISPEDGRAGEVLRDVEPEDLLKYALIPEFRWPTSGHGEAR
jgi:ATP-dependent Clp protease ATP-binding subunit ClpX